MKSQFPFVAPRPNTICMTMDVDCGVNDVTATGGRPIGIEDAYIAPTFDRALPRYLDLAAELDMPTTFFIVAATATTRDRQAMLRRMADAGHEIACHSLTHPKNLGHCDAATLREETAEAKRRLEDTIGSAVVGFRAPGFFINDRVSEALSNAGFLYSSSLNSAIVYNVLKMAFSLGRSLSGRPNAFYRVEPGALLAPVHPYVQHPSSFWRRSGAGRLLEIPASTGLFRMLPGVTFALDLMLPAWARARFLRSLIARLPFVNLVLHDFEFLQASDFARDVPLPLTTSLQLKLDPTSNSARLSLFTAAAAQKERILLKALALGDAPAPTDAAGVAPDMPAERVEERSRQ
jgi:hypothetical protein